MINVKLLLIIGVLLLSMSRFCLGSNVEEFSLENGLKILIKENHAAPVFTAQLWFKVGASDEPENLSGAAHLVEHMLFRSTEDFKAGEMSQKLRALGGIDNAATSSDYTYYWVLMNPSDLDFALKIMSERFKAKFNEDELEKEKTVVISEMQGYENNPIQQLYQSLFATSYDLNAYKRPVIGYKQDLLSMTREQIYDFYKKHYVPETATLVLVGDINVKDALEISKKYFGNIENNPSLKRVFMTEPAQKGKKVSETEIEGNTSLVLMGYHIPDIHHDDADALTVLSYVIGEGKTSRLYQNMVEADVASEVWGYPYFRRMPSLFMLGAIGKPDISEEILEKELCKQIEDIKNNAITDEEFERALSKARAEVIFENASVSGQGNSLGNASVFGDWQDYDQMIPRLEKVTKNQVIEVAQKYFIDSNLTIARSKRVEDLALLTISEPQNVLRTYDAKSSKDLTVAENKKLVPIRKTLSNGVTILVMENPSNPTVAIDGYLQAGEIFEPKDKSHISSIVSNMLMRGTKNLTSLDISKELENRGSELSFYSSIEKTNFTAKALSENTESLLKILSDVLLNPFFLQEELDKIKQEIITEVMYNKQLPKQVASRTFYNKSVPENDPNHQKTYDGVLAELEHIKLSDLENFYNDFYRPDTFVISVCGDVKADDVFNLLEKYFSSWISLNTPKPEIPQIEYADPIDLQRINIEMKGKSESSIIYGYPINLSRRNPDFYKMRLANQILGGGGALNSRFGEEIRENRGLVYGVGSAITGLGANGMWVGSMGTSPENVDEAVETMFSLMKEFKDNGVTEKELEDSKKFIIGTFSQVLETNEGCAAILSQIEYSNLGLDFLQNIENYYKDITIEDIKEVSNKYLFPEKGTLVIVGPEQ